MSLHTFHHHAISPEVLGDELPEPSEREITLALAAMAEQNNFSDMTIAGEFLANLDVEHLNAMAHGLYTGANLEQLSKSFRDLFAAQFSERARDKLRDAA